MKKIFVFLLAMVLICSVLGGCSGNPSSQSTQTTAQTVGTTASQTSSASSVATGPVVLSFLNKYPEDNYRPYFEQAIKDFEASHQNVTINMESVSDEQIKDKLRIIAGGELPDIFFTWAGEFQRKFDRAGLTLNLTPYLNQYPDWKNGFIPSVLASGLYNGENHSVPFRYSAMFMLYNKIIYDKYNLKEPATYQEMLNNCEVLKKNGEIPILFGIGSSGTWYAAWYIGTLNQLCVPYDVKMKDYNPASGEFTHPGYVQALAYFVDLQKNGYFSPNVLSVDYYQCREQFCAGQGAMIMDATSQFSIYEKDCVDDWGFFKFPPIEGAAGNADYITGGAEAYCVSAKSKNPDMAVEFVKFLTSKDQAYKQTKQTGLPNAIIGGIDEGNGSPKLLAAIKLVNDYKGICAWLDTDVDAKVADAFMTAAANCLSGKSPEEEIKLVQQAAQEVKASLP